MEALKRDKKYTLTKEEKEEIQKDFKATFSTDGEAKKEIEYFIEIITIYRPKKVHLLIL